jgi:hypothetical protein
VDLVVHDRQGPRRFRLSDFYTPLSIYGRFITDPTAHGNWPNFDHDASRRATLAVYDALQGRGVSP